ncbi:MAG: hypothetical protein IT381_05805 [Deltaproteobacteria bacterium]|nr:hypothetical protein [Deltaproteobacteria bacterium]
MAVAEDLSAPFGEHLDDANRKTARPCGFRFVDGVERSCRIEDAAPTPSPALQLVGDRRCHGEKLDPAQERFRPDAPPHRAWTIFAAPVIIDVWRAAQASRSRW